ncbi:MAG TPA: hypothetical protein VLH38_01475 [Patescibacteria group bacterium]|nr:hypothetical protein [Patescibacteria group bacterium]
MRDIAFNRPPHPHHDAEALLCGPKRLPTDVAEGLLLRLDAGLSLDTNGVMNELIACFTTPGTIDPYAVVHMISANSLDLGQLLGAAVGVKEGYRLHEHTQAVMSGFEADYAPYFPDPHERKLIRTTLLFQDMAKSLLHSTDGSSAQQAACNTRMAINLLKTVSPNVLDEDEKIAIPLLVGHDIFGKAIRGATYTNPTRNCITMEEAADQLATLKANCPEAVQKKLPELMPAIYLADITAYSSFRSYREPGATATTPCIGTLDALFERDQHDAIKFAPVVHQQALERLVYLVSAA